MLATMILPFQRCLDFRGRSRRSEFWWFVVFQLTALMIEFSIAIGIPAIGDKGAALVWVTIIHCAVFGLPMVALHVRRMHDQDKSGWWVVLGAIPYLGGGMILFMMAQPGTWGPNRFGADPRHEWDGDLFE